MRGSITASPRPCASSPPSTASRISWSVITSRSMSGPLSQVMRIGVTAATLPHQLFQRRAVARKDQVLGDVVALGDDPAAADHDVAHGVFVAGEDDGVEQHVAGLADQRRLL